jgi:hypothetical protein
MCSISSVIALMSISVCFHSCHSRSGLAEIDADGCDVHVMILLM